MTELHPPIASGELIGRVEAESHALLVRFLNTQLDAGFAFCQTARIATDSQLSERAVIRARQTLGFIQEFASWFCDGGILLRVIRLDDEIQQLESAIDFSSGEKPA